MDSAGDCIFDKGSKGTQVVVLFDPEKSSVAEVCERAAMSERVGVSGIFVGSTYLSNGSVRPILNAIKSSCKLPVYLFPGASAPARSLAPGADGFLCPIVLTSNRPEFLKGWHIQAAPIVRKHKLRSIPTGYILVGPKKSRAGAVVATQSVPVPLRSLAQAADLALAAEMMGMSLVYLDAGSGAKFPVPMNMIERVRGVITVPLLVGGGLRTSQDVKRCARAGADFVVIGNALESNFDIIKLANFVAAGLVDSRLRRRRNENVCA